MSERRFRHGYKMFGKAIGAVPPIAAQTRERFKRSEQAHARKEPIAEMHSHTFSDTVASGDSGDDLALPPAQRRFAPARAQDRFLD